RKIDSSLVEIDCNILPEVGEQQSAADQVRQMLPPGVAVAEQIKHQPSDRIRRVARIAEQIVERVEALEVQVRSKRGQKILERLARNFEAAHRISERNKYRMARRAGVRQVELALPFVEHRGVMML